ncbi:MAG: hypothetical protein KKF77_13015 [Proteobacteria bacterium]|nr:hypothetical protein [Pseudomonadota bacterium]
MDWSRGNSAVLLKTTDALKLLPNVKPRLAMQRLSEANNMYFSCDENEFRILEEVDICAGLSVTREAFNELIISDEYTGSKKVSPRGASLLLKLYDADFFELKGCKDTFEGTEVLRQYAESEEKLAAKVEKLNHLKKERSEREAYLIANPGHVLDHEFTPSLLNTIMYRNGKIGSHTEMVIGGVTVTKDVSAFASNSGKSRSNTVILSWTDNSGKQHKEILTQSSYASNRRNDAERNWGLPE